MGNFYLKKERMAFPLRILNLSSRDVKLNISRHQQTSSNINITAGDFGIGGGETNEVVNAQNPWVHLERFYGGNYLDHRSMFTELIAPALAPNVVYGAVADAWTGEL